MSNLIPFNFDDSLIRSTVIDGKPWFVARDVAAALDYTNPMKAIRDHCKGVNETFTPTSGGEQAVKIISQGDVLRLITRSRLPAAERFEAWVFDEVLPELFTKGSYSLTQQGERLQLDAERLRLKTRDAALQLLDRITTERSHPVREALYPILEQDFQALGAKAPPLEAIGTTLPASTVLLDDFWEAVDHLEASGAAISHLADPTRIAINLPHLAEVAAAQGVDLPPLPALRRALRESQAPRFIHHVATSSVITGRTMKCWIFERQSEHASEGDE